MRPIHFNGKTYFPGPTTLAQIIEFLHYFQPLRSPEIFQLTKKDFTANTIQGVSLHNPTHTITLKFNQPVTPLKTV